MKLNKNSKLEVTKIIDEWVDDEGMIHRKLITELQPTDLDLGSVKKPKNKKIIKFTYRVGETKNAKIS